MVPWVPIMTIPVFVGLAMKVHEEQINLFLMGFFRDVGRVKAYRRRHQDNSMALMTVLRKQEDPLMGLSFTEEDEKYDNVPTYSEEELWEFGTDDGKLLLSVFGRIYDVSEGDKFYGPNSRYHMFPGRDVTYALSTGCKQDECLEKTAQDLTPEQMDEGKRWLSFFQLHDKYPYVGKLEDSPMEDLMDAWVEDAIAEHAETGEPVKMPKLF